MPILLKGKIVIPVFLLNEYPDLPTLTVWANNSRSHNLASKYRGTRATTPATPETLQAPSPPPPKS